MMLAITDDAITSDVTNHHATHKGDGQIWGWEVCWLPGRDLGRDSAIAAMYLAEIAVQSGAS